MIAPGFWRRGHAPAYANAKSIPEKEKCGQCRGSGESMTRYGGNGAEHIPCFECGGSGRKRKEGGT